MLSERRDQTLKFLYNAVNYPIKQGLVYDPDSLMALRRMQELCSFGASAAGAVLGSRYGASVSFSLAASGFVAGNIVAGILFKPTPL